MILNALVQLMRRFRLIAYTRAFSLSATETPHKCIGAFSFTRTHNARARGAVEQKRRIKCTKCIGCMPAKFAGPSWGVSTRVIRTSVFVQFYQWLRGV